VTPFNPIFGCKRRRQIQDEGTMNAGTFVITVRCGADDKSPVRTAIGVGQRGTGSGSGDGDFRLW